MRHNTFRSFTGTVALAASIILAHLGLVHLGGAGLALANDASFGGCGGVMAALDGKHACQPIANQDIELVEEELHFVLRPGGEGPAFSGKWKVEGRYVLRNHGAAQTVTIGFPIRAPWGEEFEAREPKARATMEDYRVTLDGADAPAELFVATAEGDAQACAAAQTFGYSHAYLSEVAFAAGQTRTLVHTFEHKTGSNFYGYVVLQYILETGALWRGGTIGNAKITVDVQEPIAPCFAASLPGVAASWDTQRFAWEIENFKADTDLVAVFALSRVAAFFQLNFVEELEGLDAKAIAALGLSDDELLQAYLNTMALYRQELASGKASRKSKKKASAMSCQSLFELDPEEAMFGADGKALAGWDQPMTRLPAGGAEAIVIPEHVQKSLRLLEAELTRRKVKLPAPPTKAKNKSTDNKSKGDAPKRPKKKLPMLKVPTLGQ